ncbi:hypothetical protein QWV54_05335, partial [Neisseria gonorrhoeae]
GTETYRENGFFRFYVLDSRLRGNDGGEGLLFRVNPCSFSFPDSRFRGDDGGGISVFPTNS